MMVSTPKELKSKEHLELPSDFPHEPPQGYRYEVVRKNASTIAIWTDAILGLFTITAMTFVVSGDSTTQKRDAITPLLTPPSKEIR